MLCVAGLASLAFFLPLASFADPHNIFELTATGLWNKSGAFVHPAVYLTILYGVCVLLPLVTIFLYKRRLLQIRLLAAEMVLLLGAAVLSYVYYRMWSAALVDEALQVNQVKLSIFVPLLAMFLDVLAMRAIFHDERLVRSMDRIR